MMYTYTNIYVKNMYRYIFRYIVHIFYIYIYVHTCTYVIFIDAFIHFFSHSNSKRSAYMIIKSKTYLCTINPLWSQLQAENPSGSSSQGLMQNRSGMGANGISWD